MGLVVLQVRQQRRKGFLLFFGEGQWLRVERNVREKIQRLILLGHREHALFAKGVQRCLGDARLIQLAGCLGAGAQRFHRRQLTRTGLRLGGQLPCQRVKSLGRAGQPVLHHGAAVFHDSTVLGTVWDNRLDGLEPGTEGAIFQKSHQFQQVRRQLSFRRGGIVQRFQLLGVGVLRQRRYREHHRHPGLVSPAKGH